MYARIDRIVRRLCLAAGIALAAPSASAQITQIALTGDPARPSLSITGSMPPYSQFFPDMFLAGNRISYMAGGECGFLCPPPVVRTIVLPLWGLPAGSYELDLYWGHSHSAPFAPEANLTFTISQGLEARAELSPHRVPPLFATNAILRLDGFPTLFPGTRVTLESGTLVVIVGPACIPDCPILADQALSISLQALPVGTYPVVVRTMGPYLTGLEARTTLVVASEANYQGLWWASPAGVESGWGVQIAHQGNTIFATWYTYDHDGTPAWFVIPDARRTSEGLYSGALYRTTARPLPAPFNLTTSENLLYEGTVFFDFSGPDDGIFWYQVDGRQHAKNITRQFFSTESTTCVTGGTPSERPNFTDLWWNAPAGSESGWGVQIAHQGDVVFATVFGYDAQGKGRWLVVPDARVTASGTYAGSAYSTRGPAYDANPWNPNDVSIRSEGRAELTFSGNSMGLLTISPDQGSTISLQKTITRQEFGAFRTACR